MIDHFDFWEKEFPKQTIAKDFCGKTIYKTEYRTGKDVSWGIDHILPLAKKGKDEENNMQIVNRRTNEEKADLTTFVIESIIYQVKKKTNLKANDKLATYNYKNKKYCIVIIGKVEKIEK